MRDRWFESGFLQRRVRCEIKIGDSAQPALRRAIELAAARVAMAIGRRGVGGDSARMHDPIPSLGQWLRQVVTGFFAYYAVPTNADALAAFRYHIMILWMRALTWRS